MKARKCILSLALAFASLGHAHEEGHGPIYSGKGPLGGELTAVVKVADAELGRKAQSQMLLENVESPGLVRLRVLSLAFSPEAVSDAAAKLIVVFKDGHVVETHSLQGGELVYRKPVSRSFLRGELIFSLGDTKYVADFH